MKISGTFLIEVPEKECNKLTSVTNKAVCDNGSLVIPLQSPLSRTHRIMENFDPNRVDVLRRV